MTPIEALPPERRLALAWTPAALRPALGALLALDARLGAIVAQTREPLLGQMRLAWWRDRLSEPRTGWPPGQPLLASVADSWRGPASGLIPLVDAWEELLGEAPLAADAIARFAAGRGAGFAGFAGMAGASRSAAAAARAGERWALADFAFNTSHAEERAAALELARALPPSARLPRPLRGLAVLDGLASRAAERRQPLLTGRGAALAALRLGLLGR